MKVLDFGVSKLIDAAWDENAPGEGGANSPGRTRRPKQDRMALTRMNDFLGSLNYMSPEQIKSAKDVDAQTDIWSLGVIMYRLVSGKLPFTGSNDDDLVAKIMTGVVTPLSDIVTEISPEFEDVVARCLERDRRRRFRNVEELARELAPLARNPKSPSLERIALLQAAGFTPASLGVRAAEASAPRTPMAVATGDYTSSVRTMATEFRRAMMDFASQATQRGMRRKTILYLVVIVVSLIVMGGAVARYGADDGHAYPETGLPLAPGARSGVPRDQPPPPVPPALSVPPALTARIAPTALPAASAITVPSAGSAAPKTTAAARPPVVPQVRPRWTPPPPPLPAVTVTPVPGIPPSRE